MTYKISEIAQLTGLSVPTLRYYEDLGLISPKRGENNFREFDEADLHWLEFIARAKATGMTLAKIKDYSDLRKQGEATIIQRIALLVEQEHLLQAQKDILQGHIDFLQQKKKTYYDLLEKRNSEN
ncbi:MAG: MerR family transcriptional regulator [Streptococcaceae bacterium]|nr:MerR family transcriptional regulator [Streptococcaceae bacterium]